ncbi:MAG: hypothetical protein B7733_19230 [Myxococcales bacterium FL481]|nr:MAG: hypothetical protein B7733_19230 [Myxococcales bacterium FL481]
MNMKRSLGLLSIGLMSAVVPVACDGDDGNGGSSPLPIPGADELIDSCGLRCSAEGIVDGNASISGVASVDAFFSAVISVRDASMNASASIRAELNGIAASLGIEGAAAMSVEDLTAEIQAQLTSKLSAHVAGSLTIQHEPPQCEANLELSAQAAADCDADYEPGTAQVSCEGSCEVTAEVAAMCQADGTLTCHGQAPAFKCEGTCTGSCQLSAALECSGSCNGSCSGTCTACAGGDCEEETEDGATVVANCAGACDGMCKGECRLEAGGECNGDCEGECVYTPGEAGCEASATAKCDVSGMANVECQGGCEGEVKPPEVRVECEATVEAKAKADLQCTPPAVSVDFQFAANLEAAEKAAFKAWLEGFKARFSALLAMQAKLEGPDGNGGLKAAIGDLQASATGAVGDAVQAYAAGDVTLKTTIGLGCAATQLGEVAAALGGAGTELAANVQAVLDISAAVGARRTR